MSKREFPCASKAAILTSERIPKQTTLCEALQHAHTSRGHTSMEDVVVLDDEAIRVFCVLDNRDEHKKNTIRIEKERGRVRGKAG